MTINKYVNITVSLIALCLILLLTFKYCGRSKTYTQAEMDKINLEDSVSKQEYQDSLDFVHGQLDLQLHANKAHEERVIDLEHEIDSIIAKHKATESAWKLHEYNSDTGFVLAPNEYVHECEGCFDLLGRYKNENVQLRFERDSYDTLMRQQQTIQENRINELGWDVQKYKILYSQEKSNKSEACDTTHKLKASLIGMFSNPFLPKGGGFGLIYEDKKFNEYGGHVVFTSSGNIYLLNIAKTISFRRKK